MSVGLVAFIIGLFVGANVGVLAMALCHIADWQESQRDVD